MWVGDTTDGTGQVQMVLEVLANSYDQYLHGRCRSVDIRIAADGTVTVEDDGPGIAAGGGELPPLEELLTRRVEKPTVDGHRPHVHIGIGGLGLFVVHALSDRFELVTVHDGVETRLTGSRGKVIEQARSIATSHPSGTSITFRPDAQIFSHPRMSRLELVRWLEDLSFLAPGLNLSWSVAGDDMTAAGIAGLVGSRVRGGAAAVAHHRQTYETARGPIDVEVALAWHSAPYVPPASVDSFVNLYRSRDGGSHVDGMHDAILRFLGADRREDHERGLVAVVTVLLADVTFGNPTRDRLATPEARGPVSDATWTALSAWAEAHPQLAAALRERPPRK
jgi:DNA gyrase subunit B